MKRCEMMGGAELRAERLFTVSILRRRHRGDVVEAQSMKRREIMGGAELRAERLFK
jgi:hypothetical protein